MSRIRSCLSFANVVSVIALFAALGGTATAAVIITSNSQVASGTISGHNPPSGKHANIISGSVGGSDLGAGAVAGGKVAKDAITSSKILDRSVGLVDLAKAARGARAYGYVPSGLNATRSKNVVAVSNPSAGTYCVKLASSIDPSTATLIASPEYGSDNTSYLGDQLAHVEWWAGAPDCPSGQMEVRTFLDEQKTKQQNVTGCVGCSATDTYRDLDLIDQGFSFVVP
jgi:hypothetical protein